jgi:hypothetical protein
VVGELQEPKGAKVQRYVGEVLRRVLELLGIREDFRSSQTLRLIVIAAVILKWWWY